MTIEFLPIWEVERKLAARGNKITTVVFQKSNGDVVRRVGMPKVYKRRVGGETGPTLTAESLTRAERAKKALKDNGFVFFDNPNPVAEKRGFSFRKDRVIHIG